MMIEARYTSVMRSTRSGNYYNVPMSADLREISTFGNTGGFESEVVAAAWGTTTMRRLPAVAKRRDLNAALDSAAPSKDPHTFQPAFVFDLNQLVVALTKGSTSVSHNLPFASSMRSPGEPMPEPIPEHLPTPLLPIKPEAMQPRQRRRRGALSSEAELAVSYAPTSIAPPNSIIAYNLNKRKQKRLEAKSSVNSLNFEVAVADAGNELQTQYVPRYVPQYQSDVAMPASSRNREPLLDQQSYAL